MNAKLHHVVARIIYHLYRTHKLAWAHPHRKIISPASRRITITDTANDMTSTGTSIASYVIYWHYRHRAAHLTQSRCNALIHTQRDEKARQIKQLGRAIIIATLPENKDPKTKPAWTNLSSHATCHLQTKKSKWWQIWLNIRITPQWKLTTHECWTTKHTTTGIVNLLYRQDIHQHEWRHDENCIRLPAHII